MTTLNYIIYDILEKLNATSDDTRFSEEHIAFLVNTKRNMLLKQYMTNLSITVPREALQAICLSLEVDELCLDDINVVKSITKVPPTLSNTGRSNIYKAYPVGSNFTKNFNIVDYSRFPFLGAEKYNKNQIFITIDPDSYLLIFNPDNKHLLMETIKLDIVAEDPEEAYNLSCDSSAIDFWDSPYPIESSMVDILKDEILKDLLIKYNIPEDEINDGEDITQTQSGRTK